MNVDMIRLALRRVVRNDTAVPLSIEDALKQLDAAAADSSLNLDPHLCHYLQKRSYVKALDALETPDDQTDGEKACPHFHFGRFLPRRRKSFFRPLRGWSAGGSHPGASACHS